MNRINYMQGISAVALTMLVILPTAAIEKCTPCPCPAEPTEESDAWGFPEEVETSLQLVGADARLIRQIALHLQALARQQQFHPKRSHTHQLNQIRESVNRIGSRLCRLQEVRRLGEPWQQENTWTVVRV